MAKLNNTNKFSKSIFLKNYCKKNISTAGNGLNCINSGNQMRLLLMRIGQKTTKKQQIHEEVKTSQRVLRHRKVEGTIILKNYPQFF